MAPLRTAFSVTVTGEPVSPGVEPRKWEEQLVAPTRNPLGKQVGGVCFQRWRLYPGASLIRAAIKCGAVKFWKLAAVKQNT